MLRCEDNPSCTTQEKALNELFALCRDAADVRDRFQDEQAGKAAQANVRAVPFRGNYVFEVRESETQCAGFARVISSAAEEHKLTTPGVPVVECTFGNLLKVGTGIGCGEATEALNMLVDLFLDGSVQDVECLATTPTTSATTSATSTPTTTPTTTTATSTPTTSLTTTHFSSNLACTTLGEGRAHPWPRFVFVNGIDSECRAQANAINEMMASCALREVGPNGAGPYDPVVCKEYRNEANGRVERVIGLPDGVGAAATAQVLNVVIEEYMASLAGMQGPRAPGRFGFSVYNNLLVCYEDAGGGAKDGEDYSGPPTESLRLLNGAVGAHIEGRFASCEITTPTTTATTHDWQYTAQALWDDQLAAFTLGDVGPLMQGYTAASQVVVYNAVDDAMDTYTGLAEIAALFTSLFATWTTAEAPLLVTKEAEVEGYPIPSVLHVWENTATDAPAAKTTKVKGTSTLVLDVTRGVRSIIRHTMVLFPDEGPGGRRNRRGTSNRRAAAGGPTQAKFNFLKAAYERRNEQRCAQSYTDASRVTVHNLRTGVTVVHKGKADIRRYYAALFSSFYDDSNASFPVVRIEETPVRSVLMVSKVPASGYTGVNTYLFDAQGTIVRQTVVMRTEPPTTTTSTTYNCGAHQDPSYCTDGSIKSAKSFCAVDSAKFAGPVLIVLKQIKQNCRVLCGLCPPTTRGPSTTTATTAQATTVPRPTTPALPGGLPGLKCDVRHGGASGEVVLQVHTADDATACSRVADRLNSIMTTCFKVKQPKFKGTKYRQRNAVTCSSSASAGGNTMLVYAKNNLNKKLNLALKAFYTRSGTKRFTYLNKKAKPSKAPPVNVGDVPAHLTLAAHRDNAKGKNCLKVVTTLDTILADVDFTCDSSTGTTLAAATKATTTAKPTTATATDPP